MANFFCSVGYSAENVHSGMIAYLCDLWNEGEREPLRSFLDSLGVPLTTDNNLRADREWKHIDLVVHDTETDVPVLAVEMKVDSKEGRPGGVPQTIAYPERLPENTPFLYVTLGVGEFYHAPHGQRVQWIRVREFYEALRAIASKDPFVEGWRKVVGNEVDLQDRCFAGDRSRIEKYRGKTWNLYFLGHLKEKLIEALSGRDIGIDPFVYPHGPGPDTILYFGRCKLPAYLEINQDGRLNLKVYLEDLNTDHQKEERIQKAEDYYRELLQDHDPKLKTRALDPRAKSRAIMSFDVGLERQDGNLVFGAEESDIVGRLFGVLEKFYGNSPIDDVGIDPSVHPPYFVWSTPHDSTPGDED